MNKIIMFLIIGLSFFACSNEYSKPKFQKQIKKFTEADKKNPPKEDQILCIGSSSIRMWHETIDQDLQPLSLIKRGFGGSMMNEVLHYSDRIVLPYKPRAILLYEGDNDIGKGIDKKYILNAFTSFVSKVHTKLPECRIYIISVKPSIKREALWPKQQQLNSKLKVLCKTNEKLFYLDIASVLLNEDGSINKDMFIEDMLHLNERGYKAWNSVIRPTLIKHELKYEK